MPYDPIEQEIIDALDALAPYGYAKSWGKEQWTLGILGLIGAIGWRKEYSFCALNNHRLKPVGLSNGLKDRIRDD